MPASFDHQHSIVTTSHFLIFTAPSLPLSGDRRKAHLALKQRPSSLRLNHLSRTITSGSRQASHRWHTPVGCARSRLRRYDPSHHVTSAQHIGETVPLHRRVHLRTDTLPYNPSHIPQPVPGPLQGERPRRSPGVKPSNAMHRAEQLADQHIDN